MVGRLSRARAFLGHCVGSLKCVALRFRQERVATDSSTFLYCTLRRRWTSMKSEYNKKALLMRGSTGAEGTGQDIWYLWEILHPVFGRQPLSDASLIQDDLAGELPGADGQDGAVSAFAGVSLHLLCVPLKLSRPPGRAPGRQWWPVEQAYSQYFP